MAESSVRLERVITLPAVTLLQYGNGSRDSFYFYDLNGNLKLDPADKKVVEKALEKNQFEYESNKVSKTDFQRFGKEAETVLAEARRERNELRKILPSATAGQCFVPSSRGSAAAQRDEFIFSPALSLKTGRADPEKFYSILDLLNWPKKKPLDPSRCFMARALVPREKIADSNLLSKEIEITAGDLLSPIVLRALGLENGERLDAAYSVVQGAKRLHLDLTPDSTR